VPSEQVRDELPQVKEFLAKFGDRLPSEIRTQLDALEAKLS
jgi:phosphoenolpyruvate carboxykinase (GTP)